ncbi:hypothetical protein P7C71_g4153, partial [Lecanoromycetidae sp. Uapishka_2]
MAGQGQRVVIDLESDSDDSETYDEYIASSDIEEGVGAIRINRNDLATISEGSGTRNMVDSYESCLNEILEVFPDISHEHVQQIYEKHIQVTGPYQPPEVTVAQTLIEKILDKGTYPKERDRIRELKRKRSQGNTDAEEAARWKYSDMRDDPLQYSRVAKLALQEAFQFVPTKFIESTFKEHNHYYGAYFAILEAERGLASAVNPPFDRLRSKRANSKTTAARMIEELRQDGFDFDGLKQEIDSAFQRRKRDDAKQQIAKDAKTAEEEQEREHRAKGEVIECGCCFDDVTLLKVTHCNGDEPHYFCLDCAQRNAANDIGNSRYELRCMHESGCTATFSREQKPRFLDAKSIEKLERLQQQDEIRKAELPNLSTCPFCEFAAICPPIEEDREFRCHNPECAEVSCRLCKLKSHIPLTCEESKKENGVSERRVIEEARTEALIRTCGKCKVRILKEDGCNKVICTSCYAVLCDYCGKDITKVMYNHFDGQGRAPPGLITSQGGKCPLYDESSRRKDQQVEEAEKDAMSKVRAEHPELSEEDLKIKFAKSIQSSTGIPSGMQHPHYRFMGDLQGGLLRVQDFVGPLNMRNAPGLPRVIQQGARQPGGRRAEELHSELMERQAGLRLAHQDLERHRRQVEEENPARLRTQVRLEAEQAQQVMQAQITQLNQQRRTQREQARAQRRRGVAQPVAPIPAPAPPLIDIANDPWG